jgi:hypothetical protein
MEETKICSKCSENKPLSEYHKRSNRPCGVRSQCKMCYKDYPVTMKRRDGYMREYDLNKSYKITVDEYNKMFLKQKGCCAICNININEINKAHKKNLCVDHNHITKKIRGLLCDKCNRGLGLFCDDNNLLLKAINYLNANN